MIINKSLFKNFTWLSISQGANFFIPIVVYPYLLRVLTIETFGFVVLAQAVVTYFVHFVDYGFSITAVREVALNRNDPRRLSKLFNELYITKFILLIVSFLILYLLTISIKEWDKHFFLFLTSFSLVAGQFLMPAWWFQGMEKMNGIAIMNTASKVIFVLLIIFNIRKNEDSQWVNFYLGISQIIVGLISLGYIFIKYKIQIQSPSFNSIKRQLQGNKTIFLSIFSGFVSGNSNLIILGLIADPVSTGYYAIVEKILLAIRAPSVLLYQTVFPRVCLLAQQSFENLLSFLKGITKLILATLIPLGCIVYFLSDEIIYLFSGQYLEQPAQLLKIVSFVPLIAALNIPACQTMLAYNYKNSYAKITISGAIFNIIMNVLLVSVFAAYGSAITTVATELLITAMLFINLSQFHREHSVLSVFKLNS